MIYKLGPVTTCSDEEMFRLVMPGQGPHLTEVEVSHMSYVRMVSSGFGGGVCTPTITYILGQRDGISIDIQSIGTYLDTGIGDPEGIFSITPAGGWSIPENEKRERYGVCKRIDAFMKLIQPPFISHIVGTYFNIGESQDYTIMDDGSAWILTTRDVRGQPVADYSRVSALVKSGRWRPNTPYYTEESSKIILAALAL